MAVAAAIERKVWMSTFSQEYFPNLYVLLVGEPGSGKSFVIGIVEDFFREALKEHHLGKSSMTRASLSDMLNESERKIVIPEAKPPVKIFNSIFLAADEFSVLMPSYDNDMIPALQKLYDCKPFSEKKRTAKIDYTVSKPQLNLFAGTQPAYLNRFMPESAWDEGFISRTIMVYSGEAIFKNPFEDLSGSAELRAALLHDLKIIGSEYRNITIDQDAATALVNWASKGGEPKPAHPKLRSYIVRRTSQVIKLSIISAVDLGHKTITLEDYQRALGWLTEAEHVMSDIFKAMASGGAKKVMEETYYAVYDYYIRKKKPMPVNMVLAYVAERAPTHEVEKLIELMEKVGLIERVTVDILAGPGYKPRIKKDLG